MVHGSGDFSLQNLISETSMHPQSKSSFEERLQHTVYYLTPRNGTITVTRWIAPVGTLLGVVLGKIIPPFNETDAG